MSTPEIVCLTPVRNEAWILPFFLTCASMWADRIIVADQGSTDGSRDIVASFGKAELISNPGTDYDESARQNLLLEAARITDRPRVLVALDADEALTANVMTDPQWHRFLQARPGTIGFLHWANILPGATRSWVTDAVQMPIAFVDDGRAHISAKLHAPRLPDDGPAEHFFATKVLHLQYLQWERMQAKQRWYQCWERVHDPSKRPIQVYRQYHEMDALCPAATRAIDPAWLSGYERLGATFASIPQGPTRHWDEEIVAWMNELGPRAFRRLDVWDWNYRGTALELGLAVPQDGRTVADRLVVGALRRTQRASHRRVVRWAQRALIPLGW